MLLGPREVLLCSVDCTRVRLPVEAPCSRTSWYRWVSEPPLCLTLQASASCRWPRPPPSPPAPLRHIGSSAFIVWGMGCTAAHKRGKSLLRRSADQHSHHEESSRLTVAPGMLQRLAQQRDMGSVNTATVLSRPFLSLDRHTCDSACLVFTHQARRMVLLSARGQPLQWNMIAWNW